MGSACNFVTQPDRRDWSAGGGDRRRARLAGRPGTYPGFGGWRPAAPLCTFGQFSGPSLGTRDNLVRTCKANKDTASARRPNAPTQC